MEALVQAAVCLGNGETLQAETIIQTYYPFVPSRTAGKEAVFPPGHA